VSPFSQGADPATVVFVFLFQQKTKKKPRTYSRVGIIREKLGKNKENIARRNRAGALLTGLPQFEYEFVPGTSVVSQK
jgi:hypothetical protein